MVLRILLSSGKKTSLIIGVIFLQLFISLLTFAAPLSVLVTDSIAGYGADIEITGRGGYQDISIFITPPLGETIKFSKQTDSKGKLQFSLPEKNTLQKGKYTLVAVQKGLSKEDGSLYSFEIFADDPSSVDSKIEGQNVSISLDSKTILTVLLRDKHANPVSDHRVELISSRNGDSIVALSSRTNTRGEIKFEVSSKTPGLSTFTAFDQTSGITLRAREDVLFYSARAEKNVGAAYQASLFSTTSASEAAENQSGEVSSFRIDFPTSVEADSDENYLTITALDSEERVVKDFLGQVVISIPTDANADLPGQNGKYQFLKKDQGVFTFPRAVVFPEIGNHRIEVVLFDEDTQKINTNIYGRKSVKVSENTSNPGPTIQNDTIYISSPSDKSVFTNSSVQITGVALPDSDVKIFLDNIPLKKVSVSSDGDFSVFLDDISDGEHFLYAMQTEGDQESSEEISFSVSTQGAKYFSGTLSPKSVEPEKKVTITISAEKDLDSVEAIWDNETEFLKEISDGKYALTFNAPSKKGDYKVSVRLTNSLGVSVVKEVDTLKVSEFEVLDSIALEGVFTVATQSFDLTWSKSSGDNLPILYVIHAGKESEEMKKIKSVSGSNNTVSLSSLEIGSAYRFSITGIKTTGEEGETSNVITLQSFLPPTPEPTLEPTPTPTPTPTPVVVLPSFNFSAQGSENSIIMNWDSTPGAQKYLVSYGMVSGEYISTAEVNGNSQSFVLQDLIPGAQYYIQLKSLDALGLDIKNYGEKNAIPLGAQFHPAPIQAPKPYPQWMTDTGPQLFIFLGAIFLAIGGIFLSRKQRD